ncbi:MAG: NTP transferase domain-containing protein, partial [Leptospiraceae bacterium]|nr:NTP transferase domain-containing protein [Leptospiraceae bacterium]
MQNDPVNGGFNAESSAPPVHAGTRELYGLLLCGGQSRRMGTDKALLSYHQTTQLEHALGLLKKFTARTYISVNPGQSVQAPYSGFPQIVDPPALGGPIAGIKAAFSRHPEHSWLVLAVDLPLADEQALHKLVQERRFDKEATCFISPTDGLPEPLCAIYEPAILTAVDDAIAGQKFCPRKVLLNSNIHGVDQQTHQWT